MYDHRCCPLNCTHVYGYATLMERLFPEIVEDMRVSDFVRNYDAEAGGCTMRFGCGGWALDGALQVRRWFYLPLHLKRILLTI